MARKGDKHRKPHYDTKKLQRSFTAAGFNQANDFGETMSINNDIFGGLNTLRRRARSIVENNPFAQAILQTYDNNIIGPTGITLTVQGKDPNGTLDSKGNQMVADAWCDFCEYGNITTDGKHDWQSLSQMAFNTTATDGEFLAIIRRGPEFGDYGIQIEPIVADQLDENYHTVTLDGNIVYQGVELNDYGKPLAYYIWPHNKYDNMLYANKINDRIRIPAEDILHIFKSDHPKQVRGISWFAASLIGLHHTSLLAQNEIQMARLATLKQIFLKVDAREGFEINEEWVDNVNAMTRNVQPGQIDILPEGLTPVAPEWASPNSNIYDVTKTLLRSVAVSHGVSYNTINSDMESVNYSSARFQALENRSTFQIHQNWFINIFCNRIYKEFLGTQLMYNSTLPFGYEKFDKFKKVKWSPRGFNEVDPGKAAAANALELLHGTKTRSEICQIAGKDYKKQIQEAVEEELFRKQAYEAAGLELPSNSTEMTKLMIAEMMEDAQTGVKDSENTEK